MVYTPLTIKAIKIAYKAHEGQYDQSGVPYILHPVHLAEQMTDETTTCIAQMCIRDSNIAVKPIKNNCTKNTDTTLATGNILILNKTFYTR